ncbi:MAG: metallophosphoesterase [Ruminococcaceae bacterium]|nr:metallophosphoesterase [Oscillospiraceae bacterium]
MHFFRRVFSGLLSSILILGLVPIDHTAFAAGSKASVSVVFTGDEALLAGFAQSEITVTPGSETATDGYFLIYYTDSNGVLPDYDQVLFIRVNGKNAVKGTVSDGRMLPPEATGIAVFESDTHFSETTPDIKNAIATAAFPSEKLVGSLGEAEFSFGALSDTHMNYEQHNRGAYAKLAYALNFYAEKNMDLVLIAGDVTGDRGESPDLEAQYEKHLEILADSDFPAEKVYEAIGNHGNTPADAPLLDRYLGGTDEIHPFTNSPYFHLLVPGKAGARDNLFIFMAQEIQKPGDSAKYDNFSKAQIDWLEGLLTRYGETETNIFILEHAPFLNRGAGDIPNGGYTACITLKDEYAQTMRFYELLKTYKDAVVLSGHTHVSFYEDANYSSENGTLARTVHIGSGSQPCGYGTGSSLVRSYDGRKSVTPEYGSEGYTVQIYSDKIVFIGYNFSTGKKIPAACLLLPVKTSEESEPEEKEDFAGAGTRSDPYRIETAADFKRFTDGFNGSSSSKESEMYGYGSYYLQTADLDMTDVSGYSGTVANGNQKCFFAGFYDGGGHTLRVNINDTVQRSVFPYVYGTVCNLKIQGSITSETSAQPVRTLYGNLINCIFDLDLSAKYANGILYSNYGKVYNVFASGTLSGSKPRAVCNNDSSTDYHNVFHYFTVDSSPIADDYGTQSRDLLTVATAFNERKSAAFTKAESTLGGMKMLCVVENGDALCFSSDTALPGDLDKNGMVSIDDAIYLLFYANFPSAYPIEQEVDYDKSGKVDQDDAIYLLFYTNFPESYPLNKQ